MGCYNQYKARVCSYTYTECKSDHMLHTLALWGLVTNYGGGGGGTKWQGGASEVLPLTKGGGDGKRFRRAQGGGGGTKGFEVYNISFDIGD